MVNQNTHTDCNYYSDRQFACNVRSDSDFSHIHFNARSLNKNFQKLKEYLDYLKLSFDIIAISETLFVNHRFNSTPYSKIF